MYKDSIWAKEIIQHQNRDSSWGYFHTLSKSNEYPLSTEQALRRLQIFGYTIGDEPIQKAVKDHICFPLSDTWRQRCSREVDCTYRISNLLFSIGNTE